MSSTYSTPKAIADEKRLNFEKKIIFSSKAAPAPKNMQMSAEINTEQGYSTPKAKKVKRILGLFGVGIISMVLVACGNSHGTSAPKQITINIQNFAFSPKVVTVAPGATISVHNEDPVVHTLSSISAKFTTGPIMPNATETFIAPSKAGTYTYRCNIHQYMEGTIKVDAS